jgi:hypothetical protein
MMTDKDIQNAEAWARMIGEMKDVHVHRACRDYMLCLIDEAKQLRKIASIIDRWRERGTDHECSEGWDLKTIEDILNQ